MVDVMLILERDGGVCWPSAATPGTPGWYNLPSGRLEPDGDVMAAVICEAHDEIGI